MATASITNTLNWSTDAGLRTCLQEVYDLIIATGLVQTADTGQVDRFTATSSYVSLAVVGYFMFKTNDGFVDIYLKVSFAWGNASTRFGIYTEVGRGTNGAGTITGAVSIATINSNNDQSSLSLGSRACGISGCYWVEYRAAANGVNPQFFFAIMRFCGATGLPNDDGYVVYMQAKYGTPICGQVTFDGVGGASLAGTIFGYCATPILAIGAMSDGDIQTWKHYTAQPRVRVNPFALTRDTGAITEGLTRELTIASQTRTYIAPHSGTFRGCAMSGINVGAPANTALMLPWM
jgi:hypothetical protein